MSLGAGQVLTGSVDEGTPIPPPPPPPPPVVTPPVPVPPVTTPVDPGPILSGALSKLQGFFAVMDYTMWAIGGVVLFLLKHRRR